MVTFTAFSQRLARGQLKGLALSEDGLGEISPEYIDTVLSLTNQGLVELTTRQPLIIRQIDLTFVDGQHMYPLVQDAAWLDDADSNTETFVGSSFVKVLDIFDGNGDRHTTNSQGHIMLPSYNTLRFTTAKMDEIGPKIRVRYQATHAEIVEDDTIDIPPHLEIALQLFVASLYISHMGGKEHSSKGDSYYAAYLRQLGDDQAQDKSSTSEVELDGRFYDRGFV